MDNFKVPVEVDPNEDTEWNDILRDHGIIPEKPPSPSQQLDEALEEVIAQQHSNRLENLDIDDLNSLEDEEDEEFLNFYKNKRISEMKELASAAKFGQIYHITKQEYEQEVTKQSDSCFVLLHMSLSSQVQSRLLSSIFQSLSAKYPEIKFCEIPANRCIESYPESNCPTLIIYHKTNVLKQYITLTQLGGNDCNIKDIESVLVDVNAVPFSDKRLVVNQQDEDLQESHRLRFMKKSIRNDTNGSDDDDFFD